MEEEILTKRLTCAQNKIYSGHSRIFYFLILGITSKIAIYMLTDNLDIVQKYLFSYEPDLIISGFSSLIVVAMTFFLVKRTESINFKIQIRSTLGLLIISSFIIPVAILLIGGNLKFVLMLTLALIGSVSYPILQYSYLIYSQFLGMKNLVALFVGNSLGGILQNFIKVVFLLLLTNDNENDSLKNHQLDKNYFERDNSTTYLQLYIITIFGVAILFYVLSVYVLRSLYKYIEGNQSIYFYDEVFKEFVEKNCGAKFNIERQIYDSEIKSEISSLESKIKTETFMTETDLDYIDFRSDVNRALFHSFPEVYVAMIVITLSNCSVYPSEALNIIHFNTEYNKQIALTSANFTFNFFDLFGCLLIGRFYIRKFCRFTWIIVVRIYLMIIFPIICYSIRHEVLWSVLRTPEFFLVNLSLLGLTNGSMILNLFVLIHKKIDRSLLSKSTGLLFLMVNFGIFGGSLVSILFDLKS